MKWRAPSWTEIALGVGGAYLAYRLYKLFTTTLPEIGSNAGGAIFDALHPDAGGIQTLYSVAFEDGSVHAIPASSVLLDGSFMYNGVAYQMVTNGAGYHFAKQQP